MESSKPQLCHLGTLYRNAAQMKRLIVSYNEEHFKPLAPQSKDTRVIGVTPTIPHAVVDKKLTTLLIKSSEKALRGIFTVLLQKEPQVA